MGENGGRSSNAHKGFFIFLLNLLNYGYRTGLKKESVEYVNKLACLIDEHTVEVCIFCLVCKF